MYYTKQIAQALLLSLLFACSTNSPKEKELENKPEQATTQSTKIELTVYTKALIALNNDDLEKAQRLFTEMSELQPDIAGSWANLALISVKRGRDEDARKFIDIALQKNPNMIQALNLSASLEQKKGNIIKAKSLYQKALSFQPNYALAHYNLALIYDIYFQDIPLAIKHYQLYLNNITGKDKKTTQWLAGLQATMGDQ